MNGRVVREAKERRRKWAQNITPRPSKAGKKSKNVIDSETEQKPNTADGFLPEDIVQMLAARERYVDLTFFFSRAKYVFLLEQISKAIIHLQSCFISWHYGGERWNKVYHFKEEKIKEIRVRDFILFNYIIFNCIHLYYDAFMSLFFLYLLCVPTVICSLKPVILSKIGPPQCTNSALDFLKEKKMSVPRSSSVLNNSSRALRLLSSSGVLGRKWECSLRCLHFLPVRLLLQYLLLSCHDWCCCWPTLLNCNLWIL